jgi:hypothetical protein
MAPRTDIDRKKHQQDTDGAYRAIGRYVVAFAEMVREMRSAIGLYIAGGERWILVDMALGEATAQPVSAAFFSLCRDAGEFTKAEEEVADALSKAVAKAIRERNDIAHGDWTVGALILVALGEDQRMETMTPRLVRATPRGKKPYKMESLSPADIDARTDSLLALVNLVDEFGRLSLKLPMVKITPDGGGKVSRDEFRVGDIFAVKKQSKKDPIAVRTGPKADELLPRTYTA